MKKGTLIAKLLVGQTAVLFVAFSLALFLPAGTIFWPAAWIFLILFFGFFLAVNTWLFSHNPGLLQERSHFGASDQQGWDKLLFPLLLVSSFAWLIYMSFDVRRFHWSWIPGWLQLVGLLVMISSF